MARASVELITALRQTATRLCEEKVTYRWSHFAHCNCGHLAQTITQLSPDEIQRRAMQREGDWADQAHHSSSNFPRADYGDRPALDEGAWEPENVGSCNVTGTPLDLVLEHMYALGLTVDDIGYLERLSDPAVRRRLGSNTTHFLHYKRENVVAYLSAWAELLEEQLVDELELLPLAAE